MNPSWVFFVAFHLLVLNNAGPVISEHQKEPDADNRYHNETAHLDKDGKHNIELDHEAILGTDAEEMEHMDAKEMREKLQEIVQLMDTNNDTMIEKDELKNWITNSMKGIYRDESDKHFKSMDTNKDLKISWLEVEKSLKSDEESEEKIAAEKQIFEAADKDGDGTLTREEFFSYTHPEEDDAIRPLLMGIRLKRRDNVIVDGQIDFQEHIGKSNYTDTELKDERDDFDKQDVDKDGYINGVELEPYLIKHSSAKSANDETEHFYTIADDDKDGRLSTPEILKHMEMFIGNATLDDLEEEHKREHGDDDDDDDEDYDHEEL